MHCVNSILASRRPDGIDPKPVLEGTAANQTDF